MISRRWRHSNSISTPQLTKLTKGEGQSLHSPSFVSSGSEGVNIQFQLYSQMCKAIVNIEAEYDPRLSYPNTLHARKYSLDFMALKSIADIEAWERGWLTLVRDAKIYVNVNSEYMSENKKFTGGKHHAD